jgi:hypothetical protein
LVSAKLAAEAITTPRREFSGQLGAWSAVTPDCSADRRLESLTGLFDGDAHVRIVSAEGWPTLRLVRRLAVLFVHGGFGNALQDEI